jgi:hypothetical protein
MGKAPKKPDPLANIPRPGFENPQFPTIGKKEPTGTIRSQIDVSNAIGPATAGIVKDVINPFRPAGRTATAYAPGILSSLTGDASRAAASRAITDTTKNALTQSIAELNQKQQQQAEKSRAEDKLAQSQNYSDNWRADTLFDVFGVDIRTDFTQKVKELARYYERDKKNSQAMVTASMLGMLGGLI